MDRLTGPAAGDASRGARRTVRRTAAATCATVTAAAAVVVGAPAAASANNMIGRAFYWGGERVVQSLRMDDPWVFRGATDYEMTVQPACWLYQDRKDLVVDVSVTSLDRYSPFPLDADAVFFPVRETVTVNWHNTSTGQRGQTVAHGDSGSVGAGVPAGPGRVEMDIHLRSDHPWLHAAGSTHLPFGHSTGTARAVADLSGKSCS